MAEEATTQTGASEADQDGAGAATPGTTNDGGTSVTDSGATDAILAQERAKAEQVQRDLQASRDRERAAREKAERELAALRGDDKGKGDKPLTREELFAALDERERVATLKQAASSFRGADEFKYADASILARATEFDSPEALRAALETSHTEAKARIDAEVEARVQAKLAEAGKQYGIDLAPAAPATPPTNSGDPTIEQLHSTPWSQWDAMGWTDEVVDRVLNRNA